MEANSLIVDFYNIVKLEYGVLWCVTTIIGTYRPSYIATTTVVNFRSVGHLYGGYRW